MQTLITLSGLSPLLVQAPKMLNPFDPLTVQWKKLTAKRDKDRTDEERLEIWRVQFFACLYYRAEIGPFVPGASILASLRDGAKRTSRGKKVLNALQIMQVEVPLEYEGPRNIDKLWADETFRFLKPVSRGVMHCRPMFHPWRLRVEADLDTKEMDLDALRDVAHAAGRFAGLGSWRPSTPKGGQYGRYEASVEAA